MLSNELYLKNGVQIVENITYPKKYDNLKHQKQPAQRQSKFYLMASRPELFAEIDEELEKETYFRTPEICLARQINDPSFVNTPPSDFMNSLKERMCVYFCDKAILKR